MDGEPFAVVFDETELPELVRKKFTRDWWYRANKDLFWAAPALGSHEVIINCAQPVISLSELRVEQVAVAMEVWRLGSGRTRIRPTCT